jgi:hypothetical protein
MRRDLLVTFFGSGSARSSRNRSQEMNNERIDNLQTIRLPKETDSESPVGVDSGRAVCVEDGNLRKGNDDHWATRSGAESKKIR